MNTADTGGGTKAKNSLLAVLGLVAASFGVLWIAYGFIGDDVPQLSSKRVAGPGLVVGPPSRESTHWRTVVSVTNSSEARGYRMVGVQCTWFSGGAAIDSSGLPVMNVPPGQTAHASAIGPYSERSVDRVECRVSYAHPN